MEDLIKYMDFDEEILIKTSSIQFGLKKISLLDEVVVLFGGHSKIIYWVGDGASDTKSIVDDIENYLTRFRSQDTSKVWITLDECETIKQRGKRSKQ